MLPFLAKAGLISLSGALAPGPITAFAAARGGRNPHAGALVMSGHVLVEAVVVLLVFLGVGKVAEHAGFQAGIGLAGALVLLLMGLGMLLALRHRPATEDGSEEEASDAAPRPGAGLWACFVAGAALSATSPYFLVWWATVGAGLALESWKFGILGVGLFIVLHWTIDLGWCYFVSWAAFRGQRSFGERFQRGILAACGVFLVLMAGKFANDGGRVLLSILYVS